MKWKLVPVEPTEEMLKASSRGDANRARIYYRAMLSAAPEPDDETIKELGEAIAAAIWETATEQYQKLGEYAARAALKALSDE